MSDCSNHKKELFGETDMKKVAEAIEDMHYESQAELYNHLAERYMIRHESDKTINRLQLAQCSLWMHYATAKASTGAERAWQISKPFMESDKQKMMKAKDQKCCVEKCKQQAVAFWPVIDPDIPANPYCRKHLDEAKMRVLAKLNISLQNPK